MFKFLSSFEVGPKFAEWADTEAVKREPMLFSCDFEHAIRLGGPITKGFLETVLRDSVEFHNARDLIIDTRVHMLMPGWFPAIPGFHHDDVPRNPASGQPDYAAPAYRSKHVMGLVNGHLCPTEFACGTAIMSEPGQHKVVYREWHKEVERQLEGGSLSRVSTPSERLVYFNDRALHQAVPASAGGWRWFGRATINTNRQPANETRSQVQVYLSPLMEGW